MQNIQSFSRQALAEGLTRVREFRNIPLKHASQLLGIPTSRLSNYEQGKYVPSLPEIECLAYIYDAPIEVLFSTSNLDRFIRQPDESKLRELRGIRNRIIATRLSIAVEESGMSLKELAAQTSISASKLQNYLSGNSEIPFDELFRISQSLGIDMKTYFDTESALGYQQLLRTEQIALSHLPDNIKEYVLEKDNWSFIDVADKLKNLQTHEVKELIDALDKLITISNAEDGRNVQKE